MDAVVTRTDTGPKGPDYPKYISIVISCVLGASMTMGVLHLVHMFVMPH